MNLTGNPSHAYLVTNTQTGEAQIRSELDAMTLCRVAAGGHRENEARVAAIQNWDTVSITLCGVTFTIERTA